SLHRLGQHAPDGTLIAHLHDFQHSLRATLDAQGRTQHYAYTAFGVPLTHALHPVFGFAGELHDPLSGLVYLRARWYDPDSGTLLTTDPYHGSWQQPYGHHPYQYAYSNPLRFSDPSGEVPILIPLAIAAAVYVAGMPLYTHTQYSSNGFAQGVATGLDLAFGYGSTQEAIWSWTDPDCNAGERGWKVLWGTLSLLGGMTAALPAVGAARGAWFASKTTAVGVSGAGSFDDVVRAIDKGGDGLAEMRRLTGDPTLKLEGGLADGVLGYFSAQDNTIYFAGSSPDASVIVHEATHAIQQGRGGMSESFRQLATVMPSGVRNLQDASRAVVGATVPPVYFFNPVEVEANVNALYHAFAWNRATRTTFLSPTVGYMAFRAEVMWLEDQDGIPTFTNPPREQGVRPTRTGR
ncbi:RHS repeat-associated core domain-containing protein, partial [bacterium]|nr:RHS repeat-associated core domain-containing protein [bacterium]